MAISFYFDTISKPSFFKATAIKPWLKTIAAKEKFVIKELNYIFLDDEGLLKINMEYLIMTPIPTLLHLTIRMLRQARQEK